MELADPSKTYNNRPPYYTPWTPKTLHERMMVEAEAVVRYNWLDVALHDKAKIEEAPYDHVYIWIVTETGSHLIPMYCETKEKLKIEGTQYTFISHGIYNFVTRNNTTPLCNLPDHSYYLVVKRRTPDGGDIIPVDLDLFLDLVSLGRWAWSEGVGVVCVSRPV